MVEPLAVIAPHAATTSAETTPEVLTLRLETVTPVTVALEPLLTVTAKVFLASSASLTLAMVELADGLPAVRVTPTAEIVGGLLTLKLLWFVRAEDSLVPLPSAS